MQTGMNRRHFLKHVAGASAIALPSINFLHGLAAAAPELQKKNKSLIIFWMGGGPSHMDLWDLKPNHPNGGEFKPIKTTAPGIEISEVLPTIAEQFKHLSVIRSLVTNEGSHERGTTLMNTGRMPNPVVQYPALGSLTSSLLTPKDLALPGFIGVGGTAQRIGPGFLGMMYAPFTVQGAGRPPENIKAHGSLGDEKDPLQQERVRRRQRLFYELEDTFNKNAFPHLKSNKENEAEKDKEEAALRENAGSAAQAHTQVYKKGFDLTISPLRNVFDVNKEKKEVIDSYGGMGNGFGMGCLLARKLVEKGVTAVEIDLGGWDMHGGIFNAIRGTGTNMGNGGRLDKGMGTLVKELTQRGMWENTVVLWMGEFGRTPRINQNNGRDHWGRCWSVVLGGGAIKPGVAYGATSADGTDVTANPCSIGDVYATVFKGLGIDPATQVRDNLSRPTLIADGKPIEALL